jgi:hypothetical protein
MPEYTVQLYNDMGHLLTEPYYGTIPNDIFDFVCRKSRNKINYATDLSNLGCRYYILKEGLQTKWTYQVGDDTITIDYTRLEPFDETYMKMLY